MEATMGVPTHYTGLSSYLETHIEAEHDILLAYEKVAEEHPDDVAGYLLNMIVADEKRHHEMFGDMQRRIDNQIQWRTDGSGVPSLSIDGDRADLMATTRTMIDTEQHDLRELRTLRRSWRRSEGERALWADLIRAAELDTKKHILLLRRLLQILNGVG